MTPEEQHEQNITLVVLAAIITFGTFLLVAIIGMHWETAWKKCLKRRAGKSGCRQMTPAGLVWGDSL